MIAHNDVQPEAVDIVAIDVEASGIVDLRDVSAVKAVGIDLGDALSPWRTIPETGRTPRSSTVRDRLIEVGADGLIDPSRKSPGLWHLVLFRWNVADAPSARLLDTQRLGE
ncbi:RES domain-containing protein [Curtobacterium sp. VKM Ac-2852]|uniref:RES domain-containing protein n=1 Tax=Curtobacterium sp. VKM Ac-2852 TaxID=2739024 RepID=UPI001564D2C6|nr:RES domain-containing protein [Curtobacterium sp. VKM Ac-2852]NQX22927.1 RES domain-containing protein [Curtobacterium sp. VKM Ac-2852]